MSDEKKAEQPIQMDRRELLRKGAKAAYVVPAILAAVKASVRPAYAGQSPSTPAAPHPPLPMFAGTPGQPNCHGQSVSALSDQFGTLEAAAAALGFPNVQALQDAIQAFCAG